MSVARIRSGEPVFGLTQTYPLGCVAECAIWAGYDFLLLDCEHGVADEAAQLDVMRTAAGTETSVLVRIRPNDESAIGRYLDFGAAGILVPDVRTGDQARRLGTAKRRWTGGLRGDRYSQAAGIATLDALIIALIESSEGVANAEAILSCDDIDGVIVGSGDLTRDLGFPGDVQCEPFRAAVRTIELHARANGKLLGAKLDASATLAELIERGYRLFLVGRDMVVLRSALAANLAAARAPRGQG